MHATAFDDSCTVFVMRACRVGEWNGRRQGPFMCHGLVLLRLLAVIGNLVLGVFSLAPRWLEEIGREIVLLGQFLMWSVRPPWRIRELVSQLDFIGVQSVYLICTTGAFTGMVLSLQMHIAMKSYGTDSLIGGAIAVSLSRELAPVLTALLLIGRAGSAMTAELGSMKTTEQIDALSSMAVAPVQYLVVPRVIASAVVMPMLALLFGFAAMLGGYLVYTTQLGFDGAVFMWSIRDYLDWDDVGHGVVKAVVFGFLLAVVCCSKGINASGGARGVGLATTRGVVVSSFLVLASDYVITTVIS